MTAVSSTRTNAMLSLTLAMVIIAISGCGAYDGSAGKESFQKDGFQIRPTDTAFAYRDSSPYAGVLKRCVLVNTVAESCTLNELPLIGNGTATPTVDQIMERVLVTNNWMGARFEDVLRDSPQSLLTLFASTTAILIGSEVRPSFYTRLNGAIQIDPVYLWTSIDEKSSISKADDFRSDYGKDLQFWFLSRQANPDGSRLAPYYSLDDNSVRPIEHIKAPLQRLLFHELVHAFKQRPIHIRVNR